MTGQSDLAWVHYLPAATTVVAAAFAFTLFRKYRLRPTPHIGWWTAGVAIYGTGTLLETTITLAGNTVALTKLWYVAGAVLGAYPLAQGSLYLLYPRRFANRATAVSLPFAILTALLVLLSPVVAGALEPHRPSGAVLAWGWVRLLTPFINTYAAFFPCRRGTRQRMALLEDGERWTSRRRERPDRLRRPAARNRRHVREGGARGTALRGRIRRPRPHLVRRAGLRHTPIRARLDTGAGTYPSGVSVEKGRPWPLPWIIGTRCADCQSSRRARARRCPRYGR